MGDSEQIGLNAHLMPLTTVNAQRGINRATASAGSRVFRFAMGAAVSDFLAAYPDYAATARLDELRATEYSYLDAGGHVYLDYTGAGLAANAQLLAHQARLRTGVYGNPHSENPTSSAATLLVERTRGAVLRYFNATADEYAV